MDGHELRRMRLYLGLRQQDVSAGTGISIHALGAAENDRRDLNDVELRALREYYRARLEMLRDAKRDGARDA